MIVSNEKFNLEIFGNIKDPNNDNVDISVTLINGKKYSATLFTISNIILLMDRYKNSGECGNGKYFWASDLIIIRDLNPLTIEETIKNLLQSNEFESAFSLVS